jgi:hypothetical protein
MSDRYPTGIHISPSASVGKRHGDGPCVRQDAKVFALIEEGVRVIK